MVRCQTIVGHACPPRVFIQRGGGGGNLSKLLRCELGLNEKTVAAMYREVRLVIGQDVLLRQKAIVFGNRGSRTVDIEADETVIKKFKVDGEAVWYFYVWLGIMERGNPNTLYLLLLILS